VLAVQVLQEFLIDNASKVEATNDMEHGLTEDQWGLETSCCMNPSVRATTNVAPENGVESKEVGLNSNTNGWDCLEILGGFDQREGLSDVFASFRIIGIIGKIRVYVVETLEKVVVQLIVLWLSTEAVGIAGHLERGDVALAVRLPMLVHDYLLRVSQCSNP
jgi:hypothetical protein